MDRLRSYPSICRKIPGIGEGKCICIFNINRFWKTAFLDSHAEQFPALPSASPS